MEVDPNRFYLYGSIDGLLDKILFSKTIEKYGMFFLCYLLFNLKIIS